MENKQTNSPDFDNKGRSEFDEIVPVELREVWKSEAYDFTPWLASDDGIELLSDKLGVSIMVVGTEQRHGTYKCDIVGRIREMEGEEEGIVVIENQLELTDHDHLGKLLTYASGYKAKMVVWIAKEFSEEHRQALDWLNENISDVHFFGLEIGLIRIGNSRPAIQLETISSPNEWAKAMRAIQASEKTPTQIEHLHFWQQLKTYANIQTRYKIKYTRKPFPQHWYEISIGKSGVQITLTRNTITNRVGCELYFNDDEDKQAFDKMLENEELIESKLGNDIEWQRLEDKKASRIIQYKEFNLSDQDRWPEIFDWLYERSAKFYQVFSPLVKNL